MRSSPLILMSMFFLVAVHAESPNFEEQSNFVESPVLAKSPQFEESTFSSISPPEFDVLESEVDALNAELALLDEEINDWEEEFNLLDSTIVETEKQTESVVPNMAEKEIYPSQAPIVDIAMPSENLEEKISLNFIPDTTVSPALSTSLPDDTDVLMQKSQELSSLEAETPAALTIESSSSDIESNLDIELDLKRAFSGSPFIYSLLFAMSIFSVFIWTYSLLILKKSASIPKQILSNLHTNLNGNQFEQALLLCQKEETLLCKMVASGIHSRKYGLTAMIESMKAEGKRSTMRFWQKISLLNDIAILAPMLGLLGTVLGMFYAFYDVNRSIESITSLFDGLGVSVGTTVAGLIVAILALILHSTAKYRLIKVLSAVENEAYKAVSLIDNHASVSGQSK